VIASDILADLLSVIRNQFYPDDPKGWFQQRDAIILCLTRPAQWFSDRGVQFPPARYQQLIQDILQAIKRHGATAEIQWFPAYLGKAVEKYLVFNGDDLYREAKGARVLAELAMAKLKHTDHQADVTAPLAEARRILLAARKKRPCKRPASASQPPLPGL
jgi:transposase InsO family protein